MHLAVVVSGDLLVVLAGVGMAVETTVSPSSPHRPQKESLTAVTSVRQDHSCCRRGGRSWASAHVVFASRGPWEVGAVQER